MTRSASNGAEIDRFRNKNPWQHLCVNLFHLMDALDLEGVPDLEVSPGVPLKCTRDGPVASICYPDARALS